MIYKQIAFSAAIFQYGSFAVSYSLISLLVLSWNIGFPYFIELDNWPSISHSCVRIYWAYFVRIPSGPIYTVESWLAEPFEPRSYPSYSIRGISRMSTVYVLLSIILPVHLTNKNLPGQFCRTRSSVSKQILPCSGAYPSLYASLPTGRDYKYAGKYKPFFLFWINAGRAFHFFFSHSLLVFYRRITSHASNRPEV